MQTRFLQKSHIIIWSWAVPVSLTLPDGFSVKVQCLHADLVVTIQIRAPIQFWAMCHAEESYILVDLPVTLVEADLNCKFSHTEKSPFPFISDIVERVWLSHRCLRILPRMHQSSRGRLWCQLFLQSVNDSICARMTLPLMILHEMSSW